MVEQRHPRAITSVVEYTYDHNNLRIAKKFNMDVDLYYDRLESYVLDDDDIVLALIDANGEEGAGGLTVSNRYLSGPDVDQILADEQTSGGAGTVLWPLADNLGTIRDLADNTGAVVNHITYDSFGVIFNETAPTVDHRFGYTGREHDAETGLRYHRARYFDGHLWISEDPIGFEAGDANLRRYVSSSPLTFSDPTGLLRRPNNQFVGDDVWIAEEGDSFESLLPLLQPPPGGKIAPNDKFAIRPLPPNNLHVILIGGENTPAYEQNNQVDERAMKAAWARQKPLPCAWYDTSYLTHTHPKGPHLSVTVGNARNDLYLRLAGKFFGSRHLLNGPALTVELAKQSNFGQSPIPSLWVVGHGAVSGQQTGNRDFSMSFGPTDLRGPSVSGLQWWMYPQWDDAVAGRLTSGFWFDRHAEVYFIGCNTAKLAERFAGSILRVDATAWGTLHYTVVSGDGATMGWSQTGRKVFFDGNLGTATSPAAYFAHTPWVAHKGGVE